VVNKNAVVNFWRADKAVVDTARAVSDYLRVNEHKIEPLAEAPSNQFAWTEPANSTGR
jgi:hypothetical protein